MLYIMLVGLFITSSSVVVAFFLGRRLSHLREQVGHLESRLVFQEKAKNAIKEAALRELKNDRTIRRIEKAVENANGKELDSIYNDIINGRV